MVPIEFRGTFQPWFPRTLSRLSSEKVEGKHEFWNPLLLCSWMSHAAKRGSLLLPFLEMPFGHHTLLLSLEGGLLAFGYNSECQLGLGHNSEQLTPAIVPWKGPQPVQVDWGMQHSLVLDAEGGVWQAGSSRFSTSRYTFERVPDVPPTALVAAGELQRCPRH